ncbi:D-lactate dehydrogenase [Ardenticatena maritima]|uniref:D-lactate dehydrogenase (cytochrome) n=1 Tax=Ardenticatena maritima TaxID=872965 RepID=A0A0M8KBS7_9CHLR|nr:FAD-linked oxidase C-terminal domain-containing protein [Ardenticatena maritima]KPL89593.1 hypothetical protein SE16_04025 [Ardenticatena maritima]GAP64539.1 D-lactate dehydrogenase [Ardenticatena maritima]
MDPAFLAEVRHILDDARVSTGESVRALHARDQSSHAACLPDLVVWPQTTDEVSALVACAARFRVPVVGWGAGSSLEGNPIPLAGGMVIDFTYMNRILALHAADFQVVVQPGLLYKDMNRTLARHGLFFAPDPGANASIGGMIANNAAGTRTVKYGATRDNVLALEVVLADGSVVHTGSRSVKQSAGYDLTHLFIGSEGTLGLITAATLKLAPLPEQFSAAIASFPTTTDAANAVYAIMGSGIVPAALELLDASAMRYFLLNTPLDVPIAPTLLMEFHGATEAAIASELALVRELCADMGATTFVSGVGRDERDRIWQGRHHLFHAMVQTHPSQPYLITDVAVPISHYPELAAFIAELLDTMALDGALFGHAGDGNAHTVVFAPSDDAETLARLQHFNDQVVEKALALEGTCTGEHGVGIGKQKYLLREYDEATLTLMALLKRTLDPHNILNPGKVIPSSFLL